MTLAFKQTTSADLALTETVSTYAKLNITEPAGHKLGQEMATAAKRILRCLEIRDKYIVDEAWHVQPNTIVFVEKGQAKQDLASLLGRFDGDCALSQKESGKKIVWDIYKVRPPPP